MMQYRLFSLGSATLALMLVPALLIGHPLSPAHKVSQAVPSRPALMHSPVLSTATSGTLPVIFVPGISGSLLVDAQNTEYWPAAGALSHAGLTLFPSQAHPDLRASYAVTQATILGVHFPSYDSETYGPLFAFFQDKGFVQYQTGGDPVRRTAAGCDLTQATNKPNLFVFPYDWRKSNAENATALADYVACVRQFYPGTQVDLVAHSMGGLVARRYILDHPGNHHVNALVSVATPWLGAGKLVWVMETGQFVFFVWDSTLLDVIGSFTGAHELMNSQALYDLGGAPAIVEDGQDLNKNGVDTEQYSYAQLVAYMNAFKSKEGFTPGTANQLFHAVQTPQGAQDNWTTDTTGVKYFHIVGAGGVPDTINQVVATTFIKCASNYSTCDFSTWEYPKYAVGDQTVPLLSSTRNGGARGNYNAPGATVFTCQAAGANNDNVSHTALLSNPVVQNLLVQYLAQASGATPLPPPSSLACGNAGSSGAGPVDSNAFHQLVIDGATDVRVTDGGPPRPFLPAVTQHAMSPTATQMLLASGEYSIAFKTVTGTTYVEWLYGEGQAISQAVRYVDVALPPGRNALIRIRDGAFVSLHYDADLDSVPEMPLSATVQLQGPVAGDMAPPVLTHLITTTSLGAVAGVNLSATISLSVQDGSGTGVERVLVSLDGKHFQPYLGPLVVDANQVKKVYVFADDGAGNRSALHTIAVLPYKQIMPILSLRAP